MDVNAARYRGCTKTKIMQRRRLGRGVNGILLYEGKRNCDTVNIVKSTKGEELRTYNLKR